MTLLTRFGMLLVLATGAAACGDPHLGDGYGRRTRTALDVQTQVRASNALAIDGSDARVVMLRHRGVGVPTSLGGSGQTQGGGGGGGAGAVMPPQGFNSSGGIRLDAVH